MTGRFVGRGEELARLGGLLARAADGESLGRVCKVGVGSFGVAPL